MAESFKINSDFIPPAATASAICKCPYRRLYHFQKYWAGDWHEEELQKATRVQIEFEDCIGQDCAMWNYFAGCKL